MLVSLPTLLSVHKILSEAKNSQASVHWECPNRRLRDCCDSVKLCRSWPLDSTWGRGELWPATGEMSSLLEFFGAASPQERAVKRMAGNPLIELLSAHKTYTIGRWILQLNFSMIWVREFASGMNRSEISLLGWKEFYPQIYLISELRPPQEQYPFHQTNFTSEILTDITAFQSSFCVTSLDKQGCYNLWANMLVNHYRVVRVHMPIRSSQ